MKRNAIKGIVCLVAVLLLIYLGFAFYFRSHYLWHTTVGSVKCGGKTAEYVINCNKRTADDYLLTITDINNNKYHLAGIDFSYQYIPKGEEEAILDSQNPFTWPASIFKSYNYDLRISVSYDTEKYKKALDSLEIFSEDYIVAPKNAKIKIQKDSFEVIDEVMGCSPIPERIESLTTDALNNQITELTLGGECYVQPAIFAKDKCVIDATELITKYMSATIHYNIDGADENFTTEHILSMIRVDKDFNVSLSTEPAEDFVQHLASTYNTYGDVRKIKTSKGDTIKLGGGDYGWVINKSKEVEQIMADLENGQPIEREPVYEQRAIKSGLDDIGDTYIEIDYTNQHLWYYKNGKLKAESDIVSGNINRQNGSVDGIFKIVYKQKNATLVGEDYNTLVKYFMPFAYNIGIHDAGWKSKFGGTIYKTAGSHGCINVPPAFAKKLFGMVEVGTPVIAYYREKVELTNNAARMSNAYSYVEKEDKDDK